MLSFTSQSGYERSHHSLNRDLEPSRRDTGKAGTDRQSPTDYAPTVMCIN
jgi:hypothetical protein